MKKIVMSFLLIGMVWSITTAQSPEKVYSFAKVYKPHDWYLKQAELWWKEIQKNNKNEDAWYNYFSANRMARFEYDNHGDANKPYYEETKFLMNPDSLVSQAQKAIPNTFTGEYLIWRNRGATPVDFSHLQKAYNINPNFPGINLEMVVYYETQNDAEKRKLFNQKMYTLNELSLGLISYSYNVLMSLKPNSAIITFGDNDSFPLWLLQDALGIRQDVTVLQIPLLCIPEYRKKVFAKLAIPDFNEQFPKGTEGASEENTEVVFNHILKNKPTDLPVYIGLPAWKKIKDNGQNFYLVGLALEYSQKNIDNIALLKNNFENKYALDYLQTNLLYDISSEVVDKMNVNYLPGIFKLYEHYSLSGDLSKTDKMKRLGLQIAQKAGQEWIDKAKSVLK